MHMFQVLLNTGAAQVLLPSSLTNKLGEEVFREQLIVHFELAGASLDERCAITLMDLPASSIRSWADAVRMPIEVRDFTEIFSDLNLLVKRSTNGIYQAVEVLAWFNRADVWRKPDRAQEILSLAQKIGFQVSALILAMRNAQSLNTADIIAGVEAQDRSNGERIGGAFESARLAVRFDGNNTWAAPELSNT